MFSNELDLLDMRLHELADVVDRVIVVESTWTHQGRPKDLIFHANRHRFAAFAERIVHVVVEEYRGGVPWERESFQRNGIARGLADAGDDDLLVLCDLDEIPRPEIIRRIAADDRLAARVNGLSMANYGYFINFELDLPILRPLTMPCGLLRHLPPNLVRHLLVRAGQQMVPVVPNAGWHFSWLGGAEAVRRKLENFCHLELLAVLPSPEEIAAKLTRGDFLIYEGGEDRPLGRFVPLDGRFPVYARTHAERLRRLGWLWPPSR